MGRKGNTLHFWSKLRVRMMISYVLVSVAVALLFELLIGLALFLVIPHLPYVDKNALDIAQNSAQLYSLQAALLAKDNRLNPHTTFQPDQPATLVLPGENPTETVPYTNTPPSNPQAVEFALLIAPDGRIVASSYPQQYPVSASVDRLLPGQAQLLIHNALAGQAGNTGLTTNAGHLTVVAQPVLNAQRQPIGAIYLQMAPAPTFNLSILPFTGFLLFTALFWICITAPVGAIFGVLTTRKLVRRLHNLVKATDKFAQGDYSQRVKVTQRDEIGQLEEQFNSMAQQLVESIAQQKALTEQHARLEERARIEQELRTAQYIQRALLPKEVPTFPGWQLVREYRPARVVGGDFYDFLPIEDGRLGIVIGDATDKGVSAALLMATTCTMLRTATRGTTSPGAVLAQVNDLLAAHVPTGVFVTCFYAMLDPGSGRLCYANAGHDLPYLRHEGGVCELRATGMPLGLMPGSLYEEKETILSSGDNLLLYSDGLVEAHNEKREMFSFSYLMSLLQQDMTGKELIDFLLKQLENFTGPNWEQEDDVTLVTLHRASSNGGVKQKLQREQST
ncbi:MAG TPA: SpoIIE family protein phosphatase [Ktedonobacteraceae bacterium]|jgi:serine phosphatase RsbU (regulator of sigma subunit)|nr:SpoIIE family protein phosphatase [Ktedonobacteraceae bacterium]